MLHPEPTRAPAVTWQQARMSERHDGESIQKRNIFGNIKFVR